jgi:c-di-GMP-binding flagellar brake protein YcgR
MVWHQEEGEEAFYPWVVVARDERALTLVPLLKEDFPRFAGLRKGHSLTARFWRAADTEYRFTSDILAIERDSHAVILRHADSIERLQQRDFYRLDVHFEAIFFAVPEGGEDQEEAEEEERLAASSEPGRAQGALESEDVLSPGSEEADAVPFPDLDHALRVEAQVINLSAGGLSALTPTQVPPQYLLLIDPDFEGPFPLGGIFCKIVHASPLGDATHLQVQFIDLPPAREAELVRCVYHYQTQRVRTGSDPLPEA